MSNLIDRQAAINAICEDGTQRERQGQYSMTMVDRKYRDTEILEALPPAQPGWIPTSERFPECEQEVLICTEKKTYRSKKSGYEFYVEPIVTPAIYEDGTMLEVNSRWHWEDIDYAGWDEEEDCGIIPEGWWENRHFNPDEVCNSIVDQKVIAWMPLPKPWEGAKDGKAD